MDNLILSLINLCTESPCGLAEDLRAIFEGTKTPVRIREMREGQTGDAFPDAARGKESCDAVFLVLPRLITEAERSFIRTCRAQSGEIPIIAVTAAADAKEVMDLLSLGITDIVTLPLKGIDLLPRIWRLSEHLRRKKNLVERLKEAVGLRQIIGSSPALTAELEKIPLVANCDSSVFITGETGTGKEMFARAIHYLGPRAGRPFMPVNCGAIPAELIENELFGHARGAFTSAVTAADGIISEADGGTLFLDEIDSLPLQAQVKLLRFLQEKEYRQLGSAKTRKADVRVVAAASNGVGLAVSQGKFRRDLYYRLNIIPLALPPLRERRDDIPALATHFVAHYAAAIGKNVEDIAPDAMQKLLLYDWPGNVRELQNTIERAVVFSARCRLSKNDIHLPEPEPAPAAESFQEAKARVVVEFERKYIHMLLTTHQGNITQAARTAGKDRRAFWELMRKHNIGTDRFKRHESEAGHSQIENMTNLS